MNKNLNPLLEHTPWEEDKNPIWLASSFVLLRNVGKYKFPSKLTETEAKNIFKTVCETLQKSAVLKNPSCLPAQDLSSLEKELLFEHFLCMEGFQHAAVGHGFMIDDSYRLLALLNIKNHLQFHLLNTD